MENESVVYPEGDNADIMSDNNEHETFLNPPKRSKVQWQETLLLHNKAVGKIIAAIQYGDRAIA